MDVKKKYIKLEGLEIYKLSRELSRIAWEIYEKLTWQEKKVIGDQFITATDSFGANVAEGYGRGSLAESIHWINLMRERNQVTQEQYKRFQYVAEKSSVKLQNFISAIYKAKQISTSINKYL